VESSSKSDLQAIDNKRDSWFEQFVFNIKTDLLELQTQTASTEKEAMYNSIIKSDYEALEKMFKPMLVKNMVSRLVKSYAAELYKIKKLPKKLAFSYNDSSVLVWAEIPDNDEEIEDFLILLEAKINAQYFADGFQIISTIVEDCDQLPVPNHYIPLIA